MSDLVLGTIIGGTIGVIASLLGSIVQGYWSSKNTSARIKHEKEGAMTERLIAKRESYLSHISVSTSECYKYTIQIINKLVGAITDFQESKDSSVHTVLVTADSAESFKDILKLTNKDEEELMRVNDKIELYRSQNTDEKLEELLQKVFVSSRDYGMVHLEMARRFYTTSLSKECFKYDFDSYEEKVFVLQFHLQSVNRRIEQLLCGIEED